MEITLNIPDELAKDFLAIPEEERTQEAEAFIASMINNHRIKLEKQRVEIEKQRIQAEIEHERGLKRLAFLVKRSIYVKKYQDVLVKIYLRSVKSGESTIKTK